MLTTVSFRTRSASNSSDFPEQTYSSVESLRRDINSTFYANSDWNSYVNSITSVQNPSSSSTSILLSLLKEIQSKREIKLQKQFQKKYQKSTTNVSEFQFLNQKSKAYERKYKVYNFFNKPKTFWAFSYHIFVFIIVFTCLIFTVFSTIAKYSELASKVMSVLEKVIVVWFCNEFILRLWSSSCKHKYGGGWRGRWRYIRVPSHLLDLIVIVLSIVVLVVDIRNGIEVFAISAFRGFHRLFHVFQVLTLRRQIQPWNLLINVIRDQMHQLLIMIYIQFISIFILAYISYMLENNVKGSQINNLAEAMWWAVITLSTVGYGDRINVTWWGKLVSSLFTILGVALFALPAGIIGAGLAIRVEKEESNSQRRLKKLAAIVLIQKTWHCYRNNLYSDEMNFDSKSNKLFILNGSDRIAIKFIRLTQFFVAKSKFKQTLNVLDLNNAYNGFRFSRMSLNDRCIRIKHFVDTIDKSVTENESKNLSNQSDIEKRLANIGSLIDYIESEMNRQNMLIDFISCNSVYNANKLTQYTNNDNKNIRHNSITENETYFSNLNNYMNSKNRQNIS